MEEGGRRIKKKFAVLKKTRRVRERKRERERERQKRKEKRRKLRKLKAK